MISIIMLCAFLNYKLNKNKTIKMDYGAWTLAKLRDECRKRNARISGKKTQLVERLEAYD